MEDILAMEEESKRKLDKVYHSSLVPPAEPFASAIMNRQRSSCSNIGQVVSRGEDRQMLKEDNDKIELDSMSETEKLAYMKVICSIHVQLI